MARHLVGVMNYGLKKPCKTCPFVIDHNFPLHPDRIREIGDANGFPCHNTVDYVGGTEHDEYESGASEDRDRSNEHECFGRLVIQWAQYRGFDTVTAFAARAGLFNPEELPTPEAAGCFGTFDEYAAREDDR